MSFVIPSSEIIAAVASMKNPTPEKVLAYQHALEVNALRTDDPVCLYRNCLHHYSQHQKSWKVTTEKDGKVKRKSCRCKHQNASI